jgi:hypothetical protein
LCISKFVSVAQNQYYYKKKYNIWIIITITQQCVTEATLQEQIILYDFLILILNTGGYQLQAPATYICKEETSGSHCICKYSVSTNKAENKCHSLATSSKCMIHHEVSQVSYTYNNAENALPACSLSLSFST